MGNISLSDIRVIEIPKIFVPEGDVLRVLKVGDDGFSSFGEAYFSFVNPGQIKAWKRHSKMEMNIVVPTGKIRFIFTIDKIHFRIIELGEDLYRRITIPPGVWFGVQEIAGRVSVVLNIANIPHSSTEVERLGKSEIEYIWEKF